MFGFGKKKREAEEREFALQMMRAAAEGGERARVVRALATVDVQIDPTFDDQRFCTRAVMAVVQDLAKRAGQSPIWLDDDHRFTAGIFAFTLANAVSFRLGASFEQVASAAALMLTAVEDGDPAEDAKGVDEIADVYNDLTTKGRVVEAIGKTFTAWLAEPSVDNYAKLVGLYQLLGESVASPR
jgi:hypothetical protein